jgi:hypothetical protein
LLFPPFCLPLLVTCPKISSLLKQQVKVFFKNIELYMPPSPEGEWSSVHKKILSPLKQQVKIFFKKIVSLSERGYWGDLRD